MTGPEHVAEAERIIASARNAHVADENGFTGWSRDNLIALAQVHVGLAQVAATADPGGLYR